MVYLKDKQKVFRLLSDKKFSDCCKGFSEKIRRLRRKRKIGDLTVL